MNDLSAIISVLNLVGLGGVGLFLYYLFKGLNERIKTLTDISKEQEKILAVVRQRAEEMEQWRKEYKFLVRTSRTSEKDWIRVGMNLSNGVTAEVRFYPR
jgi:hypothetical protein